MTDTTKSKVLMVTNVVKNRGIMASVLESAFLNFSSKSATLNYIFRNVGFTDSHGNIIVFPDSVIRKVCREVKITVEVADEIINEFLLNTLCFKRLLNCNTFTWNNNLSKLLRKLRIYLHKAYYIAPVFNYRRARINSEILITLMQKKFYFPRFTTQLALVIFVTDANNKNKLFDTPLLQKNLRAFCDCSAFAFHRARNKLRINNQGHIF